jgi:NAD(P)-dependent dehydrogenase (short-subunit alcohol dehydrogenase family)
MFIALVTGSAGLIGSETCKRYAAEGVYFIGSNTPIDDSST